MVLSAIVFFCIWTKNWMKRELENKKDLRPEYTACSLDIRLYWAVKMLIFFCYLGRYNRYSLKINNFLPQRRFYVPQVSINCLDCPKGVKYKRISNAQAVNQAVTCQNSPSAIWSLLISFVKLENISKKINILSYQDTILKYNFINWILF